MAAADARYRANAAGHLLRVRELTLDSIFSTLQRQTAYKSNHPAIRSCAVVERALRGNRFDDALREIDRAWRSYPDYANVLAPLYGRLLAFEQRDHDATLRLLLRTCAPDSDEAALVIHTLAQLRRGTEAKQRLAAGLSSYCMIAGSLFDHIATQLLDHENILASGWIGIGPNMEFMGKLTGKAPSHPLTLRVNGGTDFSQPLRIAQRNSECIFSFELPQIVPGDSLHVEYRGSALLGSPLCIPDDFSVDGRATANRGAISGWVRVGWLPTRPARLSIENESGFHREIETTGPARQDHRWPFAFNTRRIVPPGDRISISIQVPDGRWVALPDAPLLLEPAVRLSGPRPQPLRRWKPTESTGRLASRRTSPITVIVPVYRGRQETLACIEAVLATATQARLVVVNDATDDVELASALEDLEATGKITLLCNTVNVGFVESVNRALAHNRSHDVVLLNSDALVFGDWLDRLRAAAYRHPKIGTVTPLSNSGTIATYPGAAFSDMSAEEAADLHSLAGTVNDGGSFPIPVGVGFCLFIRRDCLREVGELDVAVFGKGYGEETDFCLRAARHGWSHRLAVDVFVYHAGSLSFGKRRAALIDRSQRLINLRHPGYDQLILDFIANDPLISARRRLDERRLLAGSGTFVLIITLALTGGVQRFVTERCKSIRAQGCIPLLLRPVKPGDMRRCELWTDSLPVPNLQYTIPTDLTSLEETLRKVRIKEVELQHFLHIDPRVIELIRALGIPYDVTIHDYAWICPRVTLMDGSGRYCGEPEIASCEACVRKNGSHLGAKSISVATLRKRSTAWLEGARRIVAPSMDTARRLQKYFPVQIDVRRHTASPPQSPKSLSPRSPSPDGMVRIVIIGAIGEHKGYRVLLNCARDAKRRRLPLHFIVIGYTEDDSQLLDTEKVFITGRYSEGEAAHLLRREMPDAVFLPSVWPETWCYALDEALAAGLPVIAFELGAIAERLRETELGVMLPPGTRPRHINDRLLEVASQKNKPNRLTAEKTIGTLEPDDMKNIINAESSKDGAQSDALSASVQVLPLPAGLFLFSVKSAPTTQSAHGQQLRLPAMHVGLGPGVSSKQVEFVAGPSTEGAWLFAQEDMLVTRVSGAGATLILTSVRAPGGEVLSIKVERLENRAEALTPARPAAVAATSTNVSNAIKSLKNEAGSAAGMHDPLPLSIGTHIRARGDMTFANVPWAGRVAPGLWIESFSIKPLERFSPQDIEYKGLTGSGFETPWLSDDKPCGTKGMSVPLVGFAVRLKPNSQAAAYDCEYSGYFKSGVTIGPLRNGAPCRSTIANDPLEGLQVSIFKRRVTNKAAAPSGRTAKDLNSTAAKPQAGNGSGPSFGRYRDNGEGAHTNGTALNGKSAAPDAGQKESKPRVSARAQISNKRKEAGTAALGQRTGRRS